MARRSRSRGRQFLPFSPQGEATELQAIRVKERLGLGSGAAVDPYDVLSQVPARLLDPDDFRRDVPPVASKLFDCHADEWSATVLGHSPTTNEALILVNPTHHPHRQRVSLMEEVVHIVLDHPKTEITRDGASGGVWVRSFDDGVEDEAYSVGAACILPWPELFDAVSRRSESIVEIAQRYKVSEAYARYRILRSGLGRTYAARQRTSV